MQFPPHSRATLATQGGDGGCPQDRAAIVAGDILQMVTRALTGWLDREATDLAGARAAIEHRLRDEIEAALRLPPHPPEP
jgi:hypothetical protein